MSDQPADSSPPPEGQKPAVGTMPPGVQGAIPAGTIMFPAGVINLNPQQLGLVQQQQVQIWQGQYPPPDAIKQYEEVLPGAFDRMMQMAEKAQAAQIAAIDKGIETARRDTRRGHWLGFLTSLVAMGCALGATALHEPWVAGAFLSVPVMAVARALVGAATSHAAGQQRQASPGTETQNRGSRTQAGT